MIIHMLPTRMPKLIALCGRLYFNAKDLKMYDPLFFAGTSRGIRKIIEKKNIPATEIIYASLSKKNGWTPAKDQLKPYSKANLLISEKWVMKNISSMTTRNPIQSKQYPPPPPILNLMEVERFRKNDGTVADIETRGKRTVNCVRFLARDVSNILEIPRLVNTIQNANRGYSEGTHYVVYSCSYITDVIDNEITSVKNEVFLTYTGMLKVLFSSRVGCASKFIEWATNTLFVAQMGTGEQKEEMASELIGQPVKNVRAVFSTFSKSVPCVYRFAIGTVKSLRDSMNISGDVPDDFTVVKYGLTTDLSRRSREHEKTYNKIRGANLGLMNFSYIDPKFLSEAEVMIKEFLTDLEHPIQYESQKELVAINPAHERQILGYFKLVQSEYGGAVTDLVIQIEKLKKEIEMMAVRHSYELRDKDRIIANRDLMIENRDIIISNKEKDIKILKLEMDATSTSHTRNPKEYDISNA